MTCSFVFLLADIDLRGREVGVCDRGRLRRQVAGCAHGVNATRVRDQGGEGLWVLRNNS